MLGYRIFREAKTISVLGVFILHLSKDYKCRNVLPFTHWRILNHTQLHCLLLSGNWSYWKRWVPDYHPPAKAHMDWKWQSRNLALPACLPAFAVCSHHARMWVDSSALLSGTGWVSLACRELVPMAVPVFLCSSFLLFSWLSMGLHSLLIRMQLHDSSTLLEKAVRYNKGGLVFAKTSSIELSTSSRG